MGVCVNMISRLATLDCTTNKGGGHLSAGSIYIYLCLHAHTHTQIIKEKEDINLMGIVGGVREKITERGQREERKGGSDVIIT